MSGSKLFDSALALLSVVLVLWGPWLLIRDRLLLPDAAKTWIQRFENDATHLGKSFPSFNGKELTGCIDQIYETEPPREISLITTSGAEWHYPSLPEMRSLEYDVAFTDGTLATWKVQMIRHGPSWAVLGCDVRASYQR